MSNWIRGIYNAAADFNMRNALQSANGRTLARNSKLMREEPNECDKSNKSSESDKSCKPSCTCTEPISRNIATYNNCTVCNPYNWDAGNNNPIERDYNEYVEYTISASREDISTWVRASDESGFNKQTDANSASTVEQCTGLPTGVTV